MANDHTIVYTAVYSDKNAALTDLDHVEDLHDRGVIGKYDAAVIDKENGKPHIVKRVDDPSYDVVNKMFDGSLPTDDELNKAASVLIEGAAGLIVIAESTLEDDLDKATSNAITSAKHELNAALDKVKGSKES
jgi:hypothetical protein